MDPCRILIVEDEAVVAMDIEERLTRLGYEPAGHAVSGEEALALAGALRPDLVLMDIRLKDDMDGIVTAVEMRRQFHLPVIFLSAYSEDQTLERAKTAEPFGYILKPFKDMELRSTIEVALYNHGMEERLFRMNRLFSTLSQANQAIVRIRNREDLLPTICRVVVENSGVDLAWIGSIDSGTSEIVPVAHAGRNASDQYLDVLACKASLDGDIQLIKTIHEGESLVYPRHGNDACFGSSALKNHSVQPPFCSCASFPFQFAAGILGTLNLCSGREEFFGDQEVDLFTELARDLGFALEMIEADERRKRAETIRQVRLRLMDLALTRPLDELLQASLDEAEALTGSCIGFYHFLQEDQLTLSLQAWSSRTLKEFCRAEGKGLHYGVVEAGIWVDCIHQRRPVIHNDYQSLSHRKGTPPGHARVMRELVVPVFRGDRIVAILGVGNKPGDYDEADIEAVSHLADVAWDIAEHKLAGESIAERDRRMRTLIENLPGVVYRCTNDRDWTMEFLSEGCKGLTGYAVEDLIGNSKLSYNDLVHPDDRDWLWEVWQEAIEKRAPFQGEYRIVDSAGREKYVWESGSPLFDDAGQVIALEGFIMDITEQRTSQADLIRLATAIDQAGESVLITDARGAIQYVNPAFERTTGYTREEVLGKNPRILKSGRQDRAFYEEMWRTLTAGSVWVGRFTNKRKDGALFEEEAVISPVRNPQGIITQFVAVKRDVSKEVELEAKLRQVQKMEAVGQLAGGVAHDFNNMLSPILGYAEMLLDDLHPADNRFEQVTEIKRAAERSRDLTRQLLAFSRKQVLQVRPVVLSEIVENMEKLLRRTLREDIDLQIVPASTPSAVMADVGQLEQVLMNLVVNAQDAMPAGGRLTIEVSRAALTEEDCLKHPGALPGEYGVLMVRDTGSGMREDTLEHIFEPFYSTKGERGTGLGLATVYGVIKQHQGHILVESRPGEGTHFRVFLPEAGERPPEGDRAKATPARLTGNETILVVEDDEMVLRMASSLLMRQGYTVLPAASGGEALAILKGQQGWVDLLLTDVVMPGMNGRELYEKIVQRCPGLKVIYMSGYTDDVIACRGLLEEDTHLIQKPFSTRDLPVKVRQVLDS